MNTFRYSIAALILNASMLACAGSAWAQSYPDRPIRIIDPWAPGGGSGNQIRPLAAILSEQMGQQVVVESKPGANSIIGTQAVASSAPDGYTLLMGNAGSNGINAAIYRDLSYDLETDLTPISLMVTGPNALVINPRVFPVDNVAGLIAAIKTKPAGFYNYGSGGIGSSAHLSAELFKQMAGVQMTHIPYNGAAAMGRAAITGDAPFLIANLINVMPFVARGEVKLLAVTSLTRWPDLPDVPTLDESGLRGFETIAWNALFGPKGLPQAIVDRIVPELQRIGRLPEVVERVKSIGGQVVCSTPDVLAARVRGDIAKWRDLGRRVDIRVQ